MFLPVLRIGMFIPDPGSEFFHPGSRIPDLGKIIWDPDPESGSPPPTRIPNPGSGSPRGQKSTGSATLVPAEGLF
jgi:hypothetical protein